MLFFFSQNAHLLVQKLSLHINPENEVVEPKEDDHTLVEDDKKSEASLTVNHTYLHPIEENYSLEVNFNDEDVSLKKLTDVQDMNLDHTDTVDNFLEISDVDLNLSPEKKDISGLEMITNQSISRPPKASPTNVKLSLSNGKDTMNNVSSETYVKEEAADLDDFKKSGIPSILEAEVNKENLMSTFNASVNNTNVRSGSKKHSDIEEVTEIDSVSDKLDVSKIQLQKRKSNCIFLISGPVLRYTRCLRLEVKAMALKKSLFPYFMLISGILMSCDTFHILILLFIYI